MYTKKKLKNGITFIKVPVKGARSVTVLALYPIGSRYETRPISGASHFVEHMMFKGTEKRPEATDISRTLDALGADYNAFTSKDYTGYYIKIAAEQQEIAYDIISDILYHSKFDKDEVEKEKGAIVEELRMYKDNPTMAIDMLFDETMFGDTPLGWDIGGTPDTVRAVTRDQLNDYYREHYSPHSMTLIVAGAVGAKDEKKILKYFIQKESAKRSHKLDYYKSSFPKFVWDHKELPIEKRVKAEQKNVDQAHLILGFPGLHNTDPDRYAATILINILGVGMSSRLFVEVREKRGLAYMVRAGSTSYRDVGVTHVQAGLDPARLTEALQVIKAELERIAGEPVTAEELANAKSNISGRLALSFEDSSTQAEWFGKQYLFNDKIQKPEDILKKIKAVTKDDVRRVAKRLFSFSEMRLAIISPLPKEKVIDMVKGV